MSAETILCPCTRDTTLSSVNLTAPGTKTDESNHSSGKHTRIKLKWWMEFGLLDFDVSRLKGKRIVSAALKISPDSEKFLCTERGSDLRWFTVSTVSSPWEEGRGTLYAEDTEGKGATYKEASYQTRPWTLPGSGPWEVTCGNGSTLRCDTDGGHPKDGWLSLPLDPRLVEALVAGASHGLALLDGNVDAYLQNAISSREGARPPVLEVQVDGERGPAPDPPKIVRVEPAPQDADGEHGALKLAVNVPQGAFAFHLKADGQPVPRWQIPFAAPAGALQEILLEHLPPDREMKLELCAVDAAGNVSPWVSRKGRTSPRIEAPRLKPDQGGKKGGPVEAAGKLRLWALPELCKIDPLTGEVRLEEGMEDAAAANRVWDGEKGEVRIPAARGEIAGFQMVLHAPGEAPGALQVRVEGLEGVEVRFWRTWFVKVSKTKAAPKPDGPAVESVSTWEAEYAIPVPPDGAVELPAADNRISGQQAAAVAVDLIVPLDAKPGTRKGRFTVTGRDFTAQAALRLKIHETRIPPETRFIPELNCYGGPGRPGDGYFYAAHRLAHYHRAAINRVTHGHTGNVHGDWVGVLPKVGSDGRITDWTEYDRVLGPLLDGSAFKDLPRSGVPIACLYLPHHENWPLKLLPHYKPGDQAPLKGKNWKPIQDVLAKPIEECFTPEYKKTYVQTVADFVRHFEDKGWTRTWCQSFQNNKWYMGNEEELKGTVWILDEPKTTLDWLALKFYSLLFHEGLREAERAMDRKARGTWQYRGDISRPQWQGSCLDGLMEVIYVGGGGFDLYALLKDHKRRMPTTLMAYGGCNANDRANHETALWALKAYLHEHDGVLPWQSLGGEDALEKGDPPGGGYALIVPGKRFEVPAVASFRLHALRSGAQLVELLRLLEQKKGWGRRHSAALAAQVLPLESRFNPAFLDDAAALTFRKVSGNSLALLKEAVLELLED